MVDHLFKQARHFLGITIRHSGGQGHCAWQGWLDWKLEAPSMPWDLHHFAAAFDYCNPPKRW
jgi:hypothetical protein